MLTPKTLQQRSQESEEYYDMRYMMDTGWRSLGLPRQGPESTPNNFDSSTVSATFWEGEVCIDQMDSYYDGCRMKNPDPQDLRNFAAWLNHVADRLERP